MRRLALIVLVIITFFLGRHLFNAPVNSRNADPVTVDIPSGTGVQEAGRILKKAGVVRSPLGFALQAVLHGDRRKIQAGTYAVTRQESGSAILVRLARGDTTPQDENITIPEGFTLQQIADRLDARGVTRKQAFLDAARAERFQTEFTFLASAPVGAMLEGYLFPDTYRFRPDTKPEEVIRRMLSRFGAQWEEATRESGGAPLRNFEEIPKGTPGVGSRESDPTSSAHQVVTMASIVEREVKTPEDRRLVSGVLWKRFNTGIGLDADATIRYALSNWERPLTAQDLAVDSPYNTRRYRGLPPGPIGNPGLDSLQAALAPQESEYFYYLSASADGRTIFSETLDEHNRAKAEYLRKY